MPTELPTAVVSLLPGRAGNNNGCLDDSENQRNSIYRYRELVFGDLLRAFPKTNRCVAVPSTISIFQVNEVAGLVCALMHPKMAYVM